MFIFRQKVYFRKLFLRQSTPLISSQTNRDDKKTALVSRLEKIIIFEQQPLYNPFSCLYIGNELKIELLHYGCQTEAIKTIKLEITNKVMFFRTIRRESRPFR